MTDLDQLMDHETDPVCGMAINPDAARAEGLTAEYQGRSHFFCGRGCLLEFADDPERVFKPDHVPHM